MRHGFQAAFGNFLTGYLTQPIGFIVDTLECSVQIAQELLRSVKQHIGFFALLCIGTRISHMERVGRLIVCIFHTVAQSILKRFQFFLRIFTLALNNLSEIFELFIRIWRNALFILGLSFIRRCHNIHSFSYLGFLLMEMIESSSPISHVLTKSETSSSCVRISSANVSLLIYFSIDST